MEKMVVTMPNYNFYDVFYASPLRFQQFACAVMSVRENCVFQRFGEGRDGGIDGLYIADGERTILQAKRTAATGRALMGILRGERRRLQAGVCSRYILVLSARSIPDEQKEEIRALFPEIRSTNDIVTGEDLNGYLELPEYAHIEKEYHEFWLRSGNYLEALLEKHMTRDILIRSEARIRLTEKEKKTFIETELFADALEILRAYQRVIISGEPGAGKTAHAVCLADYCVRIDGYKELYFVNSLEEIERILSADNEKKVVVFDDFWGHGSFSESRVELNADRRMQELFRVLPHYPNVRLIFTTREFVLQQGLVSFPELEEMSGADKITLRLGDYTLPQRAGILYRHLDAVDLGYEYVEAVFERREAIIHCEAYSPRSVGYFLENVPAEGKEPSEYAEMMVEYVRAPYKYFESIFAQLSYGAKLICLLLLLAEDEIRVDPELKKEFMAVADACGDKADKEKFTNYLRELEGAFTEIKNSFYAGDEELVLDFLNHSIRDFMKDYLDSHIEAYEMMFAEKCIYYNQLVYMASEMNISDPCRRIILDRMIEERNQLKYSFVFNMDVDYYYSADASAWEYESNKIWQLYRLCRKRYDERVYRFLEKYCGKLVEGLYEAKLERSQMETLIDMITPMQEMGWQPDGKKLLKAYYDNIRWASELDMLKVLRPCCPEYFDEFMAEHLDEIRERLPGLILEDIEYYLDEWDGDERIDTLISDAPLMFSSYGIKYTKGYEKEMYKAAEREVPRRDRIVMPKAIQNSEPKYKIEQQNYKAAARQAEEWFRPKIRYLSPRKIKEIERSCGKGYRRGWLTNGEFTVEDFMIVMDYLGRLPEIPRAKDVFYEGLTEFLTEEWTCFERQALWRVARKLLERNGFYFTEKEAGRYSGSDTLTKKMTGSGIVRRTGRWYHFWNQEMMLYLAAQSIRGMDDEKKAAYYQGDVWEKWYPAQESGWAAYLAENDREDFIRYLAAPRSARFLKEIPGRSRKAREEWLMQELSWEWKIHWDGGQEPSVITSVNCLKPLEIFGEIEWESMGAAYDVFDQAAADGVKEGTLKRYGREVQADKAQGNIKVHIRDLLSSKTAQNYLREKGCYDAMGKVLDAMERVSKEK